MASASYFQDDFRGGEWSPFAQGRMTDPVYKAAMNVCRNVIPTEEGAALRRSGTRWLEKTRKSRPAKFLQFAFSQEAPYIMEFTALKLRFFAGVDLVLEDVEFVVAGVTQADPAVVSTNDAHGFVDGDAVRFIKPEGEALGGIGPLMNRTFEVDAPSGNSFALTDPEAFSFDGADVDLTDIVIAVARVLEFDTVYTYPELLDLRRIQGEGQVILLCPGFKPYSVEDITVAGAEGDFKAFDLDPSVFLDGPYLDAVEDGSLLTPSGVSGTITLTETGSAVSFQDTDVGRMIRLRSTPAAWNSATSYTSGDSVKFGDSFFTALTDNDSKQPDISFDDWALDPSAASWTWGTISTRMSNSVVTFLIKGDNLLSTSTITEWRLGAYSDTTGWPTCGTYHEGRLWLGGVIGNRFDASVSNKFLTFSPTATDGTVADNNAISYVLNAADVNPIQWMQADDQGVLMGTQSGEWLVRASSLNDPLTPTSAQAHRMTNYGSANIEPARAGNSVMFVNRHQRRLFEYTAYGEAKFGAANLSVNSKHLAAPGIAEVAYTQELTPVLWVRMEDDSLAGCTYKRDNPLGTQSANFAGWHRHDMGSGRTFTSIENGFSSYGILDALYCVTNNDDDIHFAEVMMPLFDEDFDIELAWFVDQGTLPAIAVVNDAGTSIRLWNFSHLAGETLAVFAAGLDLGDYTVTAGGYIDIPLGDPDVADGLFTATFLQNLTDNPLENYFGQGVFIHKGQREPGTVDGSGVLQLIAAAGDVTGNSFGSHAVDWDAGLVVTRTSGADIGYRVYNVDDGSMLTDRVAAGGFEASDPFCFGTNGRLYTHQSVGPDRSLLCMNATTLADIDELVDGQLHLPLDMIGFDSGGTPFIMELATQAATWSVADEGITIIEATEGAMGVVGFPSGHLSYTRFGVSADYDGGSPCAGRSQVISGHTYGEAYVLAHRNGGLSARTNVRWTLYRTYVFDGTLGFATVGVIDPSSIEATWTHFSECAFGCYDETDGNIIGFARTAPLSAWDVGTAYQVQNGVQGSDGHAYWAKGNTTGHDPISDAGVHWADLGAYNPTSTDYIFKVNSGNATIMWATAVDDIFPTGESVASRSLYTSRCQAGRFGLFGGGNLLTDKPYLVIDTATGDRSDSITIKGVSVAVSQYSFDDFRGAITFKGSYTQAAGTPLPVPPNTPNTFSASWLVITGIEGSLDEDPYLIPIVAGYPFTSQGQILRPVEQSDTGAVNGPAFGKTRRSHEFACLLHRSKGVSFGTEFASLRPAEFKSPGGTAYNAGQLYSGTFQNTLEDDYSTDSMLAWETTRPLPTSVLAIGAYLKTQDK